jgi:two-component system, OmpR family, response regulator
MGQVTNKRARVLVVAPDPRLRDSLSADLSRAGYAVTSTSTGAGAVRMVDEHRHDLIVVDVSIPDVRDLARDRPVFTTRRPPVLCMTTEESLHTLVPEVGESVEDYVTKPCRTAELLARVQVLLRERPVLRHADLRLDENAARVWRGDRPIPLTAAEFRLLRHLLGSPGQVFSSEQLAWQIWSEERGVNAIERLVSRLRGKLGPPALIHTRRGLGYRLGD